MLEPLQIAACVLKGETRSKLLKTQANVSFMRLVLTIISKIQRMSMRMRACLSDTRQIHQKSPGSGQIIENRRRRTKADNNARVQSKSYCKNVVSRLQGGCTAGFVATSDEAILKFKSELLIGIIYDSFAHVLVIWGVIVVKHLSTFSMIGCVVTSD